MAFLPVNRQDMLDRGWDEVDFVYVIGDAYVDHHSFGPAIISRVLEQHGYRIGIIAQPDWHDDQAFTVYGRPRLGFLVSSGNIDPMVNHYTVAKKRRTTDAYSPGGQMGLRPDRATTVYTNCIRRVYKDVPVIAGGIEASLRRLAHYDYWDDRIRASLLSDSGADMLIYGMGERSIVEVADALQAGIPVSQITYINGTVYRTKSLEDVYDYLLIDSFEKVREDKQAYARAFLVQYRNQDPVTGKRIVQQHGDGYIVCNMPQMPLSQEELDAVYGLPYMRTYHPMYEAQGGIPAIQEVKFSLVSNRGCFGGCSFCALTFHQGRRVTCRSHESLIEEAKLLIQDKDFKGYIHDVGGPTANFRATACKKQEKDGVCPGRQCLFPKPCPNMEADHSDYIELLRKLRSLPGVKKVFIRSGLRFDYILADKTHGDQFMHELCQHHISGQLKVAPEHISENVLRLMGKPENSVFEKFVSKYKAENKRLGKPQYLVPYLISSHPGSTLKDAIALAEYIKRGGHKMDQVQDFYPTPGTLSTCMYYTGLDPRNMKPIHVTTDPHEKAMQRALMQFENPRNYQLVKEALLKEKRIDLIGYGPGCLIAPQERDYQLRKLLEEHKKSQKPNTTDKSRGRNKGGKGQPGKNVPFNYGTKAMAERAQQKNKKKKR
ncbi:MAG: YgiQ family radical SAM protein [Clostridia bacterium]|nr:YgiQ family radical SAM protein [Clostridia bacterium]